MRNYVTDPPSVNSLVADALDCLHKASSDAHMRTDVDVRKTANYVQAADVYARLAETRRQLEAATTAADHAAG